VRRRAAAAETGPAAADGDDRFDRAARDVEARLREREKLLRK
jgi:hypothetical protein